MCTRTLPSSMYSQRATMSAHHLALSPIHACLVQVLLRWGIQRGFSVIPKATSPDRIRENFGALSFELSSEQMEKLSTLEYQVQCPAGLSGPELALSKQDRARGAICPVLPGDLDVPVRLCCLLLLVSSQ